MHLRAAMPPPKVAARGQMDLRIARKVAALAGVAGPSDSSDDAGRGQSWLSDYRALTTTELALGGPVESGEAHPPMVEDAGVFRRDKQKIRYVDSPDLDYMPIPNVTLRAYGPDTKAALVLTGVNRVLQPITAVIKEALKDIRLQVNDEALLLAVGQSLIQEAFQAQPILMLHGIQSSLIQRALGLSELIKQADYSGVEPVRVARVEYDWPRAPRPRSKQPEHFELIHEVWDSLVKSGRMFVYDKVRRPRSDNPEDLVPDNTEPFLRFNTLASYGQDEPAASIGGSEARERLVSILMETSTAYLAGTTEGLPQNTVWITRSRSGTAADVVLARQRQIELMLTRLSHRLAPLQPTTQSEPNAPRLIRLPTLNVAAWSGHPLLMRRAVLLAHYYAILTSGWIHGMKDLKRRRDREDCAQKCDSLVAAVERLLDQDDPLRPQLAVFARSYRLQYDACRGAVEPSIYNLIIADLDLLIERAEAGKYSKSMLLELLPIVLVELNTVRHAMQRLNLSSKRLMSATVTADLERLWGTARAIRDLLVRDEMERLYTDRDYAGFLVSDTAEPRNVHRGLRLFESILLASREVARREGRYHGLRLCYQVYLRGLRNGLFGRLGNAEEMASWASSAMEIADELESRESGKFTQQYLPDGQVSPAEFDLSVLIRLIRLAEARVAAVTSGFLPDGIFLDMVSDEAADRSVKNMNNYIEEFQKAGAASLIDELRRCQAEEITKRWLDWQRRAAC